MKAYSTFDFYIQTIIIGGVILMSAGLMLEYIKSGLNENRDMFDAMEVYTSIGGLILGPWQMISAIAGYITKGPHIPLRRIHLVASLLYLLTTGVILMFTNVGLHGSSLVFWVPICLAMLYYFITIKTFMDYRETIQIRG